MSEHSEAPPIELRIPEIVDAVAIGRGSFGVVYRAVQPAYHRSVAVKVLSEPLLDDDSRHRFERECQALGRVSSHPNIVTMHSAGMTPDGHPYLVMDYLTGGSLADRLRRGELLSWSEAVDVGIRMCGALAEAHASDILHRDVKPENILVSRYGEPHLADFGVARIGDGGTTAARTSTGNITGSLAHASPEVVSGVPASPASDIWSLASTISTLITGDSPFHRDTDETLLPLMTRILTGEPRDLRPYGVPEAVCLVLDQAMAKDSWKRPASAVEFGSRLQQLQSALGRPETTMAVSDVSRGSVPPVTPRSAPPEAQEGGLDANPGEPVGVLPPVSEETRTRYRSPERVPAHPPAGEEPVPAGRWGPVASAPTDQARPGPRLEGYRDLVQIGVGASAVVYRAWQESPGRAVAVKVLDVMLTDRRSQHDFVVGRAPLDQLSSHPNIVAVLESGIGPAKRPYLVMEFCEGGSLAARIVEQGPFDLQQALSAGIKVAGALESAHRVGVVHRDVRPENVLFSARGEPALADFGLAALHVDSSVGSGLAPVHAAPELLEGDPASAASDIYALGSTVFTLLSGSAPFAGPPGEGVLAQLMRIMAGDLPLINRPDVPPSLRAVLRRSMARSPADRYRSAFELGSALQAEQAALGLVVTEPVVDVPGGPIRPTAIRPVGGPSAGAGTAGRPVPPTGPDPTLADRPSPPAAVRSPAPSGARASSGAPGPPGRRRARLAMASAVAVGVVVGAVAIALAAGGHPAKPGSPATTSSPIRSSSPSPPTTEVITSPAGRAPTGLMAQIVGGGVVLRWVDHTGGEAPQLVYTFIAGAKLTPQAVPTGETTWLVRGAVATTPACFDVVAVLAFGPTPSSPAVTATSSPACIDGATP